MKALVQTDDGWPGVILRLTLGLVMLPHGAQKLLGWFGGFGFDGTMGYFTQKMGMPWIIALLVIIAESFGSVALLGWVSHQVCGRQLGRYHGWGHHHGASAIRVLHELVRSAAGRRLRVSCVGHRTCGCAAGHRKRSMVG